jgi:N-acetylglutamate synthase-like GNAT family acetyltransferase
MHLNNIIIKEYEDSFEQAVIDVILPIQTEEFSIPITIDQQPDLKNVRSFYCKGKGNFWIALHNEEVIGTVALIDIGNNEVALRKMFVKKEFRGKEFAVAQQLMNIVFDWCTERKVQSIYLGTIEPFKAAQKFYEKNGFENVNVETLPESFPRMAVDNIFYRYIFAT